MATTVVHILGLPVMPNLITQPASQALEDTIQLIADERHDRTALMFDTARDTLKTLGRGGFVPAVFGPDRPIMRDAIIAVLRGIEPTEDDRIRAAFGSGNPRRIAAYDQGIKYLRAAYNTIIAD